MKVNKIFSFLSLAAVALVATGCIDTMDTDAQIDIKPTTAPKFVSSTPDDTDVLLFGHRTIKVTFDKNIGFATKNTSKITLNGNPVAKLSDSPGKAMCDDPEYLVYLKNAVNFRLEREKY